ncbi:putative glycoprotein [Sierra Nevada virus]|uniref:Putative glycoprotein n=1 Tax=Sierra Nevada virus TaxID=1424280 RepID=A0A067YEY0_9MONO|nr:putative glycoprotein [Sierra Nevada virus]AHA90828.1 putative glycoprotein [Sierra Nevada virus]
MICPRHGGMTIHRLPEFINCQETDRHWNATVKVYKKNLRLWDTNATSVFKEEWKCSSTCYFFGSEATNYEITHRVRIGEPEARDIKAGRCTTLKGTFGLTPDEHAEKKDCSCSWTGTDEASAHRCKRQEGTVQVTHGGAMFSGLGPVSHCNYTTGVCELPDNQWLFWQPVQEVQEEFILAHEGVGFVVNNRTLILPDLQETLFFENSCLEMHKNKTCLATTGFKVELTATPIESPPYQRRYRRSLRGDMVHASERDLHALEEEILGKMGYLESLWAPYIDEVDSLCQQMAKHERQLRMLAATNPTLYLRAVYSNPFLAGAVSGDFIGAWPCKAVMDYDFLEQASPNCTRDPPVEYRLEREGPWKPGYLDLATNIILETSPRINCKYLPTTITGRNGRLFLYKGGRMHEQDTSLIRTLPGIKKESHDRFLIMWNDTWLYNETDFATPDTENQIYQYIEEKIDQTSQEFKGDTGPRQDSKKGGFLPLTRLQPWFSLESFWRIRNACTLLWHCGSWLAYCFQGEKQESNKQPLTDDNQLPGHNQQESYIGDSQRPENSRRGKNKQKAPPTSTFDSWETGKYPEKVMALSSLRDRTCRNGSL